jgi:hypothetical protein
MAIQTTPLTMVTFWLTFVIQNGAPIGAMNLQGQLLDKNYYFYVSIGGELISAGSGVERVRPGK